VQEGHAVGLQAGEAEARAVCAAELAALHADLARRDARLCVGEALHALLAARDEDQRNLEDAVRATISAALTTLFPTLLRQAAGQEIAALLADALTDRPTDTLTLRAHPETIAAVQAESLAAADTARLTLVPDPMLAPGAATLSWSASPAPAIPTAAAPGIAAAGGVTFDPAALLARVTAILRPCPALSETPAT